MAAIAVVCLAQPARAQFGGGRGGGRSRGGESSDSADGRAKRDPNTINLVDVVLERRADLGLTPEQIGRVNAVKVRRDAAVDTLSVRAASLKAPSDPNVWTTMTDSDRTAMRDRLRARAAALRAQRDAEAQARADALAALNPDQRERATKMEDAMRRSAFAEAQLSGAARSAPPRGGGGFGGRGTP
ncbi:MAG TPA: hypothetical protein VGD56_11345 [Gemmatirosa sp.]